MKHDEAIEAVRNVRRQIDASCGREPKKLVEHYRASERRYASRLLDARLRKAS